MIEVYIRWHKLKQTDKSWGKVTDVNRNFKKLIGFVKCWHKLKSTDAEIGWQRLLLYHTSWLNWLKSLEYSKIKPHGKCRLKPKKRKNFRMITSYFNPKGNKLTVNNSLWWTIGLKNSRVKPGNNFKITWWQTSKQQAQ